MRARHPSIPRLWLITDARNDAMLARAIMRLPRGSGLVFRHWHLDAAARRARFEQVARLARARDLVVVLAGTMRQARRWGADGAYGPSRTLTHGTAGLRLATAHSMREVARAVRSDAVMLSPVFATRSHPGAMPMGALRFLMIARHSPVPVIALGGMTPARGRRLRVGGWAAIDGLSP